jgi:hypothetical protein
MSARGLLPSGVSSVCIDNCTAPEEGPFGRPCSPVCTLGFYLAGCTQKLIPPYFSKVCFKKLEEGPFCWVS